MKWNRKMFIDLPMKCTDKPKSKENTDKEKVQHLYDLANKLGVKIGEQEK